MRRTSHIRCYTGVPVPREFSPSPRASARAPGSGRGRASRRAVEGQSRRVRDVLRRAPRRGRRSSAPPTSAGPLRRRPRVVRAEDHGTSASVRVASRQHASRHMAAEVDGRHPRRLRRARGGAPRSRAAWCRQEEDTCGSFWSPAPALPTLAARAAQSVASRRRRCGARLRRARAHAAGGYRTPLANGAARALVIVGENGHVCESPRAV